MRILIVSQYYAPESVGEGIVTRELAIGLKERGHEVTVLTAFPNYPQRIVFEGYRRKLYMRENLEGINVIRTYIYASPSNSRLSRAMNWGSFSVSSAIGGILSSIRPDVVYSRPAPFSMGVPAALIARAKGRPLVTDIQDLYPLIAVELGILNNPRLILFLERIEERVYRKSRALIGICEGFREHYVRRGVPVEKTHVVTAWVDPGFIRPGPRSNSFRASLRVGDDFMVLYSGGLSYNSCLEPLVEAAKILEALPVRFVIVGEGAKKEELERRARDLALKNLEFLPFQPLERYPEVLQASDISVVTLNTAATFASVPSKILKQMAAGRAVLAITAPGNELDRMIRAGQCGLQVQPEDADALADALRWAVGHREEIERMGSNAREYVTRHHDRDSCIDQIEQIICAAAGGSSSSAQREACHG